MMFAVLMASMIAMPFMSAATNQSSSNVSIQENTTVSANATSISNNATLQANDTASNVTVSLIETSTSDKSNATITSEPMLTSITPTQTADQEAELSLDTNKSASAWTMGWKKIGIWFTFNQVKKAQAELELAKLRLIQAKIAEKNNNTLAMQKAIDAHNRLMDDVQIILNKIAAKNVSINGTGLDRAIEVHELRIAKIQSLLASANLSDEQKAKLEKRLNRVQNVTAKLENVDAKIEEKAAKIEAKVSEIKDKVESENNTVKEVIKEGEIKTIKRGGEWRPVIPDNPTPVAEINLTTSTSNSNKTTDSNESD